MTLKGKMEKGTIHIVGLIYDFDDTDIAVLKYILAVPHWTGTL